MMISSIRASHLRRRQSLSILLLLLLLQLLRWQRTLSYSFSSLHPIIPFDEQFHDFRFVPQNRVMEAVVAVLVDFRRIGAAFEKRLHDAYVSVSTGNVQSRPSLDFDVHQGVVDEIVERRRFRESSRRR